MVKYSFLKEALEILKSEPMKKVTLGMVGAKAISFSVLNSIVTSRISKLRKAISGCETRKEAERILLEVGYTYNSDGTKDVKLASINYAVTDAVVGPCLQIVRNQTDSMWKEHVLNYLKLMTTVTGFKSILATLGALGITVKMFKK